MKRVLVFVLLGLSVLSALACRKSDDSGSSERERAHDFELVRVTGDLAKPRFAISPPGDDERLFIVERVDAPSPGGRIRILSLDDDSLLGDAFLTVSDVSTGGEQGLLGLAFHPNYDANGFFFVSYTDSAGRSVIERYQRSSTDPNLANPASGSRVLRLLQPSSNHNGGWIGFGADGLLYISIGDGGSSNDLGPGHTPNVGNAQDITDNLLGKMLRIDVDGIDAYPLDDERNYAIPASNPFVGIEGDDEIWVYGLRNAWRASFDRQTHDFYIADVGQDFFEELNVQPAGSAGGENYGWRLREGVEATPTPESGPVGGARPPGAVDPIFAYAHDSGSFQGCSITGGYVYRGPIESLDGLYFFADFCTAEIASLRFDASNPMTFDGSNYTEFVNRHDDLRFMPTTGTLDRVTSFGEDNAGNLYVLDSVGDVFRLQLSTEP